MSLPSGAGALPIKRNKTVCVKDAQTYQHLQFIKHKDELLLLTLLRGGELPVDCG